MSVDLKHPNYDDALPEWRVMRDTIRGMEAIKERQAAYLPMPSGFAAQTDKGVKLYSAYITRAQFPGLVRPMVRGMTGVIHKQEAKIELPKALEPMREKATSDHQTLDVFQRRITAQLLATGRYSILCDAPEGGSDIPFLAGYTAESLINWDENRQLFVLDESGWVRNGFQWAEQRQYRALKFDGGSYTQELYRSSLDNAEKTLVPQAKGGRKFTEIPFVVVGATDLSLDPDEPPLIEVANAALAAYRLDADYRWQLFMSGQETFVCTGVSQADLPKAIGAGIVIGLPADADAKYVGPSGTGINMHRTAIIDEVQRAISAGSRVFDNDSKAAESAEALRLRYAAQTASLISVAKCGAAALEKSLKFAALFAGANPDEVKVEPNLKFIESVMNPSDASAMLALWTGRAISKETLFWNLQKGEFIPPERTFEEEEAAIEAGGDVLDEINDPFGDEPRGRDASTGGTRTARDVVHG